MTAVTVPTTASFCSEGCFERGPVAGLRDAEARELVVALFVAAAYGDGDLVAGFHALGVVRECGTRQNTFDLVANVEENLIGRERDDGALNLLHAGGWLVGVAALELGEDVGEVFLRLGRLFGWDFRSRRNWLN